MMPQTARFIICHNVLRTVCACTEVRLMPAFATEQKQTAIAVLKSISTSTVRVRLPPARTEKKPMKTAFVNRFKPVEISHVFAKIFDSSFLLRKKSTFHKFESLTACRIHSVHQNSF